MHFSRYQSVPFRTLLLGLLVVLGVAYTSQSVGAQFTPTIDYQGKLNDSAGVPVSNGTYEMHFRLYTAPSGGSPIWSEVDTITVTDGLFAHMLGSSSTLTSVDFNQPLYLGVEIAGDGEMTPRKPLGAVPAAFEAQNTQTFAGLATTSFLRSDQADEATSLITFSGGLLSSASSTITNLTTTFATTTNLIINNQRFTTLTGYGLTTSGTALTIDTTTLDTRYASTTTFDTEAELEALLTDVTNVFTNNDTIDISANTNLALTATGLTLNDDTIELTAGYTIPLTASTTAWQTFYDTPSSRISAGTGLSWSGNTLNAEVQSSDLASFGTDNQIPYMNAAGDDFEYSSNLVFDGTDLNLGGNNTGLAFQGTRYFYASTTLDNIAIGEGAGEFMVDNGNDGDNFNIFLGYQAGQNASSTGAFGNINNNFIGRQAGQNNTGENNNLIGYQAGENNVGYENIFIGTVAGANNVGYNNNAFGNAAGQNNTGSLNNFFGPAAGRDNTGSFNNFFGQSAGKNNTGSYSEFIGFETGARMSASSTVAIGGLALRGGSGSTFSGNNATTTNNVAIGYGAGYNVLTGGDNNILLGYQAADSLTTGANNIIIGYDVEAPSNTGSNQLNIGNLLFGTGIDGTGTTLSSGNIGIGTTSPSQKVTVDGNAYITGALFDSTNASGTNGMVLLSTGAGTQWVATSSLGIGGSSLTVGSDNQIPYSNSGGTDFDYSGNFVFDGTNLGIGTSSPTGLITAEGNQTSGNFITVKNTDTSAWNGSSNSTAFISLESDALSANGGNNIIQYVLNGSESFTVDSIGTVSLGSGITNPNFPQLNYVNDSNTGLYRPGADTLSLVTGGSERLRVGSTGNIGIGTTTTSQTLTVDGNAYITGALFDSTNASGTNGMVLQSTGVGTQWVATSSLGIGGEALFTDAGDSTYLTSLTDRLLIGTSSLPSTATNTRLAVYGGKALIAPSNPLEVGSANTADVANDVAYHNGYAYLVSDNTGDDFEIFDVSNPSAPTKVTGLGTGSGAEGIFVTGNYAYIAESAGLEIVDVSDPTNPVSIGATTLSSSAATDVTVSGQYAYVVTAFDEFDIVDVSDPTNPVVVGNISTGDTAYGVQVQGNYAYIITFASPGDDLSIYDISDPTTPVKVGGIDVGVQTQGLAIDGSIAYVVTTGFGDNLYVYDISEPTLPVLLASEDIGATAEYGYSVTQAGNYLYIGGYGSVTNRVYAYDVTDPTTPIEVGRATSTAAANGIAIAGNYVYTANQVATDGFQVFDIGGIDAPSANVGSMLSNRTITNQLFATDGYFRTGLNVGNNALISGALTITGNASSSLLASNTNQSLVVRSGTLAFGTTSTSTTRLTIQSNGTNDILNLLETGGEEVFTVLENGNVGIGTTSPYAKLSVVGNLALTGGLFDSTNSTGTAGYILQTTNSGTQWVATSSLGLGNPFGGSINADELASEDFGDFTCNGTNCSLDDDTVTASELAPGIGVSTFVNDAGYLDSVDLSGSSFLDLADTPGSFTSNAIPYESGSQLVFDGDFTYNGSQLTVGGAGINLSGSNAGIEFQGTRYFYASTTLYTIAIGEGAGENMVDNGFSGSDVRNVWMGFNAGQNASSTGSNRNSYNVGIGQSAGRNNTGIGNQFIGGFGAGANNTGGYNAIIGTSAGANNTGFYNNIMGGQDGFIAAGLNNTGDDNNLFGLGAGQDNTGDYNNLIGRLAGVDNTGSNNNFFGQNAGRNNTGSYSEFIGFETGGLMSASSSVAIGGLALRGGSGSIFSGNSATTTNNVAIGYGAGLNVLTGGDNNILLGYRAADSLTTGANNIIIGYDVEAPSNTGSNQLNIGNLIFGTGIDGTGTSLSSGNIGIGTSSPASKLDVWGDFRAGTGTTPTLLVDTSANQVVLPSGTTEPVLTFAGDLDTGIYSEFANNLYFQVGGTNAINLDAATVYGAGTGAYLLNAAGSAEAAPTYAFLGDDDTGMYRPAANQLGFSTNGGERLRIDGTGNIGIGTTSPSSKLTVAGNTYIGGNLRATGTVRFDTLTNGVLLADANGNLSAVATSSLGFTDTTLTVGSDNQIPFSNSGGTDFDYSAALTFDGTNLNLGGTNTGLAFQGTRMFYASTTNDSIAIGEAALEDMSSGNDNVAIGLDAGRYQSDSESIFIGSRAGRDGGGIDSVVIGTDASRDGGSDYSVIIGNDTTRYSGATSSNIIGYRIGDGAYFENSVAFGNFIASEGSYSTVSNSVMIGNRAGLNIGGGDNNILLGYQAADSLTTGANNIIIGYDVEAPSNTGSNQLNIGNLIFGTGIDGTGTSLSSGNIGVGTSTPSQKLTVDGNAYITGALFDSTNASGTNGMVLLSTGAGTQWVATSSLGIGGGSSLTFGADNQIPFSNSGGTDFDYSSALTFDGTNLNLGGTNTGLAFQGTRYFYASTTNDSIAIGENAGAAFNANTTNNVALGMGAGQNASGIGADGNSYIGVDAGQNNSGSSNNVFGSLAGFNNSGGTNNLIGLRAGYDNSGSNNNIFGDFTGYTNTGSYNNIIGSGAASANTGSYNNFIGRYAGYTNTGSYSNFIGFETGQRMSASNTVAIGGLALRGGPAAAFTNNATTTNNVAIGYGAGLNVLTGGDNNILLGYRAADSLTTGANNIIIGYDVEAPSNTGSNQLNIGNLIFGTGIDGTGTSLSSGNIGIGTTTPNAKLTVAGDINIDDQSSGLSFMGTRMFYASTTNNLIAIGESAGSVTTGDDIVAIGVSALGANTTGNENVAFGNFALQGNETGFANTAIGHTALYNNTGFSNTAVGHSALYNKQAGNFNTALGAFAGQGSTTEAFPSFSNGVYLGTNAGFVLESGANNNILLGYNAANSLTSGANNIIIGYDVEAPSNTGSNQLNIGNLIFGTGIDGTGTSLSSGNIGIGTTSPAATLDVWGDFRVGTSGTPTLSADPSLGSVYIGTTGSAPTQGVDGLYTLNVETTLTASSSKRSPNYFTTIANPSEASDMIFSGLHGNAQWDSTSNLISDVNDGHMIGVLGSVTHNSAATANFGIGVEGRIDIDSTGTLTDAYGFFSNAANAGGGNITNFYGYYFPDQSGISGITNKYSFFSADPTAQLINTGAAQIGTRLTISTSTPGAIGDGLMLSYASSLNSGADISWAAAGEVETAQIRSEIIGASNAYMAFSTYNGSLNEAMRIDGGGNVGIGTTTPGSLLHVYAGASGQTPQSATDLFIEDDEDAQISILGGDSQNNRLLFGSASDSTGGELYWNFDAREFVLGTARGSGEVVFRVDAQNEAMRIDRTGNVGIGTSSPTGRLTIDQRSVSGNGAIAGIDQFYELTNSVTDAVVYGGRTYISATNTATTTVVGDIMRLADTTTFGNTVRGFEVQANLGGNTQGENTALSGFARTFGVRGFSSGDAGGTFEPAGGFFETGGSTQGNAIRGYSSSITTSDLLSLYQEDSVFAGTGLLMNFGNGTGSFASTTSSKFVDFQNAGTSKFTVTAHGTTTIGDGTTNNMAGLQIGYGGLCVDNDGSCVASTTGTISAVDYLTGNSDLAEMYFSSQNLEAGELVASDSFISVARATGGNGQVLGVVSTKPGLTLGSDDSSLIAGQKSYPLALSGRVPVKLSDENGPIAVGDPLTLSSIPGVAMKATGTAEIVGYALEAFDGTYAYTDGFVNQFGDDIAEPNYDAINVNETANATDGCYFGGGGATGATSTEDCDPTASTNNTAAQDESAAVQQARYEAEQAALQALRDEPAETVSVNDTTVRVGRVTMFVDRGMHFAAAHTDILNELTSTSSELVLGTEEGSGETLWSRLKVLAQNFVDGVLAVTGIKADKVETDELCVDGVCVTGEQLRALLENSGTQSNDGGETTNGAEEDTTNTTEPEDQNTTNDDAGFNSETSDTSTTTSTSTSTPNTPGTTTPDTETDNIPSSTPDTTSTTDTAASSSDPETEVDEPQSEPIEDTTDQQPETASDAETSTEETQPDTENNEAVEDQLEAESPPEPKPEAPTESDSDSETNDGSTEETT